MKKRKIRYRYSNFVKIHNNLLKNKNFLNNQNYILGKSEKKKVILKLFIEKFLKIRKYFQLPYKKDIFYNFLDGVNLNDIVNKNYGKGTPLKLDVSLYILFVIILGFFFLLFILGTNFFLSYYLIFLLIWFVFILFFLYINIFFILSLPFIFIYSIFFLLYLILKLYIINGYNNYYILKFRKGANLVKKYNDNIPNMVKLNNNFYTITNKNNEK